MVELAAPLRAWANELALFAHDDIVRLGSWIEPLHRMLGPVPRTRSDRGGEPDGYGGLERRGSYERLVTSEWLWAIEQPEEFLRRAVMGEQAFLAPQFREPGGSGSSVVLLDAGPRQLGVPRLAQLALLIVFARRAAAARVRFTFGILQDDAAVLHALDASGLRHWTAASRWSLATMSMAWSARLAELRAEDLWLVGAPREVERLAAGFGAHAIAVDEIESEREHVLLVESHPRGSAGGRTRLAVPEEGVAVRLLRHPGVRTSTPESDRRPIRGRALGQLVANGRRLLLGTPDGGALALHIPGNLGAKAGRSRQVAPIRGQQLLAIGMHGGHLIAAWQRDQELVLAGSGLLVGTAGRAQSRHSLTSLVPLGIPVHEAFQPGTTTDLCPLHVHTSGGRFIAWLIDAANQLFRIDAGTRDGVLAHAVIELVDASCHGFTRLGDHRVAWWSKADNVVRARHPDLEWKLGDPVSACVFTIERQRLVMARSVDGRLEIHTPQITHAMGSDGTLIGLLVRADTSHVGVFVSDDRRAILCRGNHERATILTTSTPIDRAWFEPSFGRIVYRTVAGEHGVFSVGLQQMLWRRPGLPEADA